MYLKHNPTAPPKLLNRWGSTSVVVAQAYAGDFAYGTKD